MPKAPRFVDRLDVTETFCEALGTSIADPSFVKLLFCVLRQDRPPISGDHPDIVPVARLVLTRECAAALHQRLGVLLAHGTAPSAPPGRH